MIVQSSWDLNFQVMDKYYYLAKRFILKLKDSTCECGYWEINDLPCSHARATISYAICFTKQAYINAYLIIFSLIPNQRTWKHGIRPLIEPPNYNINKCCV